MSRLRLWIRDVFRRRTVERELEEELQFHLDNEIQRYVEAGLDLDEANRRARAELGGIEGLKEECRETRAAYGVETTLLDLRYGARFLRRNPAFTLTAVATLALTIGAVSTLLTLSHTFFVRHLPVPEPDRVVEVSSTRNEGSETGFVSYTEYTHFKRATETVRDLAAVYPTAPLFVSLGDEARQVNGAVVSANFLPMLGVEPALGRFFSPEEDAVANRDRVAILGYDFWRAWFGASESALGESVNVNGVPFTVIGVAPATFRGTTTAPAEIYIPTMMLGVGYRSCSVLDDETCTILQMIGRLEDGATVSEANAEIATLIPERWRQADDGDNSGAMITAIRGAERSAADRQFMRLLAAVGGILLLVCCANLAGLQIARGNERNQEMAIRASLGAPTARLVRQLLSESLLLALVGGSAGVLVSLAFTRSLDTMFFSADVSGRPLYFDFTLEPVVVLTVLAISLVAGLLFGVVPALLSVRASSKAGLAGASRAIIPSGSASRWLLAGQAASAVALVVVAALLSNSAGLLVAGVNYDPTHVALLRLRPRLINYAPEKAQRYLGDVVERLEELPGVESVTMVGTGIALAGFSAGVARPDATFGELRAGYIEVGPRYFETIGTPLLRGREFSRRDAVGAPLTAIVSESLAAIMWPEDDPIGSIVVIDGVQRTVVGLVADVPLQPRSEPPLPYAFAPFWQNPQHVDARLQVRVDGDPATMIPVLSREIQRVDPNVPVAETITLQQRMRGRFRRLRMSATAVAYAAGLAVILSAVGLYASLAAAVSRRTKEIAVRQALGASAARVHRLIAREGMAVIAVGILAGVALAALGTNLLQHLLYGAASGDTTYLAMAAALVTTIGLFACWIPARRAARIQPMTAIRRD